MQEAFLSPLALRRALRPHARLGPHLGARHRAQPRDRRAAARAWSTTAGARATRASRSASRPRERTDVEAARREEAREVRAALETLPDDQSQVIELAYFGGFTHSRDRRACSTRRSAPSRAGCAWACAKMRGQLGGLGGGTGMTRLRRTRDTAGRLGARRRSTSEVAAPSSRISRRARTAGARSPSCTLAADALPLAAPPIAPPPELQAAASWPSSTPRRSCCAPPGPRPTARPGRRGPPPRRCACAWA